MSDTVAELERELAEAQNNLDVCNQMLALDPKDADSLAIAADMQQEIENLTARIAAKKAEPTAGFSPDETHSYPQNDDALKHRTLRNPSPDSAAPAAKEAHVVFNVKDSVMAKYSDDKQWYPATILSKTGSSTDPVYTVKFTGYGNQETKRKHEVRAVPVDNSRKRKPAEEPVTTSTASPQPAPPSAPSKNGAVISAAPSVDPALVVKKREPSKVSDGPTRMAPEPKKLKGSRALDKAKTSWNDWQKSGPKKPVIGAGTKLNKDSQFRTLDLPNAKGSGKPMQKDPKRAKWVYGQKETDTTSDDNAE